MKINLSQNPFFHSFLKYYPFICLDRIYPAVFLCILDKMTISSNCCQTELFSDGIFIVTKDPHKMYDAVLLKFTSTSVLSAYVSVVTCVHLPGELRN